MTDTRLPICDGMRSSAKAFRDHPIYDSAGEGVYLVIQAEELERAADIIDALVGAVEALVECFIKRGPWDEPLGSSEQAPSINAGIAALAKARNLSGEANLSDLLPCPFCGSEPWSGPHGNVWAVQCVNNPCTVKPAIARRNWDKLVADWNTRTKETRNGE